MTEIINVFVYFFHKDFEMFTVVRFADGYFNHHAVYTFYYHWLVPRVHILRDK